MFFFFRNKNIDPMKIKKFYYYSPDKLKLIPINNFIRKSLISLTIFSLLISFVSILISNFFLSASAGKILENQKQIMQIEYEKELELLKTKYIILATDFNKILGTTNDVRVAVNLEPLDLDERNFGIGGSENVSFNSASFLNEEKLSNLYKYVNSIESNLKFETSNYEEVKFKFLENKELFKCIPAIKPVKSRIGDRFGMRYHPILKRRRMHHGLDFLSNTGEQVIAPGDGQVTYVGKKGGYGKVIRIKHGFGYESIYAHLSKYKVKKGQKVNRGDLIAISGNSGSLSTGPHLHYEVRHNGVSLNPKNFLFEDLKLFE